MLYHFIDKEIGIPMPCFACDILVTHSNSYSYGRRADVSAFHGERYVCTEQPVYPSSRLVAHATLTNVRFYSRVAVLDRCLNTCCIQVA